MSSRAEEQEYIGILTEAKIEAEQQLAEAHRLGDRLDAAADNYANRREGWWPNLFGGFFARQTLREARDAWRSYRKGGRDA